MGKTFHFLNVACEQFCFWWGEHLDLFINKRGWTFASEWDYDRNGELRPNNVMPGSQKKVGWKCMKGHSWRAAIYSRKNHGCPVCSGRQAIPGINDLKTTMPEVAEEWDYEKNGDLRPEDVTAQSNRYIWWRCKRGHSWKAQVCDRYHSNGCPKCDGRIKMRTHFMWS